MPTNITSIYRVINFIFYINSYKGIRTIDSTWEKFKYEKKDDYDIYVKLIHKKKEKYGIEHYKIEKTDFFLFRYQDGLMLVDRKWEKVTIIGINTEIVFAFLIQIFHTHAVRNHMIQVHSSLIEYKNNGIMFLGPSGIGKTTQAELWHQYLDALIINGDMVFMEDKGDEFIGWGTPWHGSSPYCENTSVPVKALVVLKQGQENRIRKLEGFEKVSEVSNNIIYPMWIEDGMDLCLETLDHLLTHIPVYELVNKADEDSVLMVKQVVFDEKN